MTSEQLPHTVPAWLQRLSDTGEAAGGSAFALQAATVQGCVFCAFFSAEGL